LAFKIDLKITSLAALTLNILKPKATRVFASGPQKGVLYKGGKTMSFPKEKYATFPAGASQPKPQSQQTPAAAAEDAVLAQQPWATAPPKSVLLNIRLNPKRAERLMALGIGLVERDNERHKDLDRARAQEARQQYGSSAAQVLNRYGRVDTAGNRHVDTGIQDRLHEQSCGLPICLDRIWWDLEKRLGMKVNNIHLLRKEGDQGYSLRIFFSPGDQPSTAPSGLFFWEYFRTHPPFGVTDVNSVVKELMDELDEIQKRLYYEAYRWRNPNGTWTINTGRVWEGPCTSYWRVRLLSGGKFRLEKTAMPSYRRRSVEPPQKPPTAK
jgi:hypothetical protein